MVIKMNQRVMLTKRLLKENLLRLLQNKTIQEISVKELCSAAEINRSTFYAYYGCPQDVLTEIEKEFVEEMMKRIPKDGSLSQKERLLKACQFLHTHIELEKILFRNNSDEDISKLFGDTGFAIWQAEEYFGDNFFTNETDRKYAAVFINGGMYRVLRRWLLQDADRTPEEIADLIAKMILG